MIVIHQGFTLSDPLIAAMFADRKKLFVDLLDWDVPTVAGRYEIDQFDSERATYLIAGDGEDHQGSLRLLPTNAAHILGNLFPSLCDGHVPRGPNVAEITRLCLPPGLRASERLRVRNVLISAMVDHALEAGITTLTGVVSASFLEQVLVMGWRCEALGAPRRIDGARLGAFRVEVEPDTPDLLAATGIYLPRTVVWQSLRQVA